MATPDYSSLDKYKSYGEQDEDASEGKLPASLMMLADKLGFDEEKAQALKDFIEECMSSEDSGEYQDTDEDGE